MDDAQTGRFTIVFAESLDRISRDQEDIAGVYKRLSYAGMRMVTLAAALNSCEAQFEAAESLPA